MVATKSRVSLVTIVLMVHILLLDYYSIASTFVITRRVVKHARSREEGPFGAPFSSPLNSIISLLGLALPFTF
jgi:hypothetical protein